MMVQTTKDRNVRRMFNAKPLNNAPPAIRDTMVLWFHIAILRERDIMKTMSYCEAESKG